MAAVYPPGHSWRPLLVPPMSPASVEKPEVLLSALMALALPSRIDLSV